MNKYTQARGKLNKKAIIDFLKLNYRWYSISDLADILNINPSAVRSHCQNLVDRDVLEETKFYKYNNGNYQGVHHYRYQDASIYKS